MSVVDWQVAVQKLRLGEVVAIPTETVYGLAACIDQPAAIAKVFALKERPFFDPLIVHVSDIHQARPLAHTWPEIYDVLVTKFWPGPLTLIAEKVATVSSTITSGHPTVALRSPRHPLAQKILQALAVPLAAPSANHFGKTSPTTAKHVETEFSGQVSVVDGGPCAVGVESTVLRAQWVDKVWRIELLRPGGVSREALIAVLDSSGLPYQIVRTEAATSPGHLPHHYQPDSPLVLLHGNPADREILKWCHSHLSDAIRTVERMTLPAAPELAARQLYRALRDHSKANAVIVLRVEPYMTSLAWEAIWDRLTRAASRYWQ